MCFPVRMLKCLRKLPVTAGSICPVPQGWKVRCNWSESSKRRESIFVRWVYWVRYVTTLREVCVSHRWRQVCWLDLDDLSLRTFIYRQWESRVIESLIFPRLILLWVWWSLLMSIPSFFEPSVLVKHSWYKNKRGLRWIEGVSFIGCLQFVGLRMWLSAHVPPRPLFSVSRTE